MRGTLVLQGLIGAFDLILVHLFDLRFENAHRTANGPSNIRQLIGTKEDNYYKSNNE